VTHNLEVQLMNDTCEVYLKPNVVVEPLFGGWYAWTHLISPATAAMNVAGRHMSIMQSYAQAPQVHAAAVKNPALLGGPFMHYEGDRSREVRELIDWTCREQGALVGLAEDIKALDQLLEQEAKGFSLEPLYPKVPEALKGYVELVYDLNNNPAFRFLEPLVYHSPYYNEGHQSLALSLVESDAERPFVLSTPRLPADGAFRLEVPFAHEGIDALFRAKEEKRPLGELAEAFQLAGTNGEWSRFFTEEPPAPYRRYEGDSLRTRYFGHACILVESRDVSILSDPVISYEYHSDLPRYTYSDLPDFIDYVVITHNHQDHILFETLLQLRHKIGQIIVPRNGGGFLQDPSLKLALERVGFRNVVEMDEMERLEISGGEIIGLPFLGEHSDLNIQTKLAYYVQLGGRRILLAADSCNVEPRIYEHVHREVGDLDVLFLGMECDGAPLSWLYGPLLTRPVGRDMDHSRRLSGSNYQRAKDLVDRFNPKEVYIYAMGMEPWLKYIMSKEYTEKSDPIIASNRLIEECCNEGRISQRLFGEKEILVG
jgi:L-ascorbate metabolism protein UlaG (beta-lactamase superfamily)